MRSTPLYVLASPVCFHLVQQWHPPCIRTVTMPASTENTDVVDSVPATPGRSATLPSPVAGQNTAQLSSSPNTSKSRFASTVTAGAQDSLGSLGAGLGTKSMPGSRRTSAIPGNVGSDDTGSFGLDKLSLGDNKGKEDGAVSRRWVCVADQR